MELKNELSKLKKYLDENNEIEFNKLADFIKVHFTSEEEQAEIDKFILSGLQELTEENENAIREMSIRMQLLDVIEVVSLSYIAKKYFNKTRNWIYQKINGNMKNGKPAKFTESEIVTLNFAIQDISKRLGSITIS